MDSLITAAAQALAVGDALGAMKRVALRNDPPALALRGIAMAQLGDLARAKALLKGAALAFGPREPVARARCVVAQPASVEARAKRARERSKRMKTAPVMSVKSGFCSLRAVFRGQSGRGQGEKKAKLWQGLGCGLHATRRSAARGPPARLAGAGPKA